MSESVQTGNVEIPSDWTVLVSGPLAQKVTVLADLDRAGADLSEGQENDSHWRHVYQDDDPTVGWVRFRCGDLNEALEHVARAGWVHRAHWPTPACGVCGGSGNVTDGVVGVMACRHCAGKGATNLRAPTAEELLRADLEQMRAEIAALKARG